MTPDKLSPRLQLAGMAMQGLLVSNTPFDTKECTIGSMSLKIADSIIAADAKSPSDQSEMARTITRLEKALSLIASCEMCSVCRLIAQAALSQDSEASK